VQTVIVCTFLFYLLFALITLTFSWENMSVNKEKYIWIIEELKDKAVLVAVSKTKPVEDIKALYDLGQRDFGENYVQELVEKEAALPKDIRWHFIGHLQSNKVKYIAPFVHLIHGVDSFNLLKEINKQALKNNRIIDCLLQIYIAKEETKFGMNEDELMQFFVDMSGYSLDNIRIIGMMGMASFTDDVNKIRKEFRYLETLFAENSIYIFPDPKLPAADSYELTLSMGMSSDYKIALEEGSTMVRIGSLLFGERNYNH
jgi:pyridoxal phosphate enzyme (YggS family)